MSIPEGVFRNLLIVYMLSTRGLSQAVNVYGSDSTYVLHRRCLAGLSLKGESKSK